MRQRFWIAVLALGLLAWFVHSVFSGVDGPTDSWPAHDQADARLSAVKRASAATVPGAVHLEIGSSGEVHGERSVSGDTVTYLMIYRRRLDLDGVEMSDERGDPVRTLLALAEEQARILGEGGFQPLRGDWSTSGDGVKQPVMDPTLQSPGPMPPPPPGATPRRMIDIRNEHRSDSGNGSGGDWIDADAPRVTSHRMYVVPKSGVALFVRNSFDRASRTVEIEFSYADRTLHGVEYPTGGYIQGRQPGHYDYREWIEKKD